MSSVERSTAHRSICGRIFSSIAGLHSPHNIPQSHTMSQHFTPCYSSRSYTINQSSPLRLSSSRSRPLAIRPPYPRLIDLLVWQPLVDLEILLLEGCVEDAQAADLAGRGCVVALDVCFGFAVGGLEGEDAGGLRAEVRRAEFAERKGGRKTQWVGMGCVWGLLRGVPLSCGADTRSSPRGRAGILPCPTSLRARCWLRSRRGLLARRGSSARGLRVVSICADVWYGSRGGAELWGRCDAAGGLVGGGAAGRCGGSERAAKLKQVEIYGSLAS